MRIFIFLLPLILCLFFLLIKISFPFAYKELIKEDAVVENAQAFFYFSASIFSFMAAKKFLQNKLILHGILYGILAAGLLFIAGEEISWGQRILNIKTTDFFEHHNWQHETNLHNLDTVKPLLLHKVYVLIGAYGSFAWLLALPFLRGAGKKRDHIVNYVVPDWHISSCFFISFFIFTLLVLEKAKTGSFIWMKDQEIAELILAMGFLLFAIDNNIKLRVTLTKDDLKIKLQKKWNRYLACIIGIVMIVTLSSALFTLIRNAHIKKNMQQAEIESMEVDTPSKPLFLLNRFNALCPGGKCTDPKQAIGLMNELIRIDSNSLEAYYKRGTVYTATGQYQEAIQDFSEVIRLNPDHIKAHYNRGIAFLKIKQYQQAIGDFDRSIRLKPDYADAYNNRATAYLLLGNKISGCADAKKACELGTCRTIEAAKNRGYCP